jgi:hypothetical protein
MVLGFGGGWLWSELRELGHLSWYDKLWHRSELEKSGYKRLISHTECTGHTALSFESITHYINFFHLKHLFIQL